MWTPNRPALRKRAPLASPSATENNSTEIDQPITRWVASLGYDYPMSKRTAIDAVASYANDKMQFKSYGEE